MFHGVPARKGQEFSWSTCQINRLLVNVKKTKIMRLCKGGGLRKKPIICYGKEPIEFVNDFVYLGIKFQTNLKPTKHLKHLVTKAVIATNSLTTKLDLNKVSLISATQLFNNVIIPAATYGHHIFKVVMSAEFWDNHKRQIYSIFFKKWAAIPRQLPTMPLIDAIFGPDPLKIAERQPRTRTAIAMYYNNGCHHKICVNGNCFSSNQGRLPCKCIFCLDENYDKAIYVAALPFPELPF